MKTSKYDVIGIPMGTRLQQVVLVGDEVHIWTACGPRIGHYDTWLGTFLRVEPNGRVTRVTKNPDGLEADILEIKRANT